MLLTLDDVQAWHTARGARAPVLSDIRFEVPSGAFSAVLGPSGSGKSTLLRVIAGLHRDASGTILLGEARVDGLASEKRRMGLVPQDGALFPHLTVAQNIAFGLPRAERRAERRGRRVAEMLELFALSDFAARLPHQISGGQAQRVAVARALAPAPDLILLDEPFSALDAALRGDVRESVRAALAETGTTALLVTHDQGEALSIASHIVVLSEGRVRQTGAPQQLYEEPVDLWTGRFLGEANVLPGDSDGALARTALGVLPHPRISPGEVDVLIRPEQLRLDAGEGEAGPVATGPLAIGPRANGPLAIGIVQSVRYFGHDALVTVGLEAGTTVLVRISAADGAKPGERALVRVNGPVRAYPRA